MGEASFQTDDYAPTDAELIGRFKGGDEQAFSQIVERYQKRLVHTASMLIDNPDDAADMVQDTFVKAYFNLKGFREESALYTWLYRILYNRCVSALRRNKIVRFVSMSSGEEEMEFPSRDFDPEEESEHREIREDVDKALKELPPKQRMVFVMKQIDGLKHEEIARTMGITEGAVKASYFHAVRKLRERLGHYRGSYEV